MLAKIGTIIDHLMIVIRYLYLLRFSLALWLFALALVGLNLLDQTLTSGVLVPEFSQAYVCVAFFLVSSGFAALISARVTLINGPERLDECPDPSKDPLQKTPPPLELPVEKLPENKLSEQKLSEQKPPEQKPPEEKQPEEEQPAKNPLPFILKLVFVNDDGKWEWVPVILSLLPTILVGIYLTSYGSSQGVNKADIILGFLSGMLLAGVVWYVVNLTYYITYDAPKKPWLCPEEASLSLEKKTKVKLGVNAARTILYPRWLFRGLTTPNDPFTRNKIEGAETILKGPGLDQLGDWFGAAIVTLVGKKGYADPKTGKLYEAQIFAIIAMFVFLGLYLMIWPMAAPVPSLYFSVAALAVLFACSVFATALFLTALPSLGKPLKVFPAVFVWLFFLLVCWFYLCTSAERFPIFAIVLILAISLFWALAGIAFYVDRFRVPVFTVLLLLMIIPRLPFLHLIGGLEEHYFSTVSIDRSHAAPVPTPAEILESKLRDLGSEQPLIIVTATGGGLHASAWTATVLAQLETQFASGADATRTEPFNKHLLLASTVSGGSVGLDAYLRYLHDAPLGTGSLDQMQATAQCSSLEAVGWGLVYYDLPKAFLPLAPYVAPPSSGDGDLDSYGTPFFKDRTWSLRKGFERNQANTYCEELWEFDKENNPGLRPHYVPKSHLNSDFGAMFRFVLKMNRDDEQVNKDAAHQLTLRSFPAASENGPPAFSMNTTSVEEGSRFLLANYQVPHYPLDVNSIYPAQSFLNAFGSCSSQAPDLPLSAAAQLSATFPYVSSAARVPKSLNCHSVHFVDGGYYDNDGTASALEFLRYALASPEWLSRTVAVLELQAKAKHAETRQDEDKATHNHPGQNEIQPCDPDAIPSGDQNIQLLCGELSHLKSVADKIKQQKHPLRIVWIEIRNSGDFDGGVQQTSGGNGADLTDSNLLGQLGDVPLAFWQAGHESVTARNRVALGLTEQAIPCEVQIHRIIIADSSSKKDINTDPLNWSLTPIQRYEVRNSATKVTRSYIEAKKWFYNPPDLWDEAQAANDTPCVTSAQVISAGSKK
jgi:hypothetical protein